MKTRCVHCGKEFEYDGFCCQTMCDECTKEWAKNMAQSRNVVGIEACNVKPKIGVPCVICGEIVELTQIEESVSRNNTIVKVCDKCKQAVMKMREHLKEGK